MELSQKSRLLARRFAAFIADYLIVILPYALMLYVVSHAVNSAFNGFQAGLGNSRLMLAVPFLTLTLPVIIYYAAMESSGLKASLGKSLVRLQVITTAPVRIAFSRAFVRNLLKFIPWELGHQIALIFALDVSPLDDVAAYLLMAFCALFMASNILHFLIDIHNRTLYDRWSLQTVSLKVTD